MAEIPASWDLRTKKRTDGKLDVVGKTDTGEAYKVRTCDSGAVTDADVRAIAECDREQYRSRDEGARAYVKRLVDAGRAAREAQDSAFQEELEDLAGPVVHAGLERTGATVGSTRAYRRNWDTVFGKGKCRSIG
jgi:hypothetical protein